MWSYLKYAPVGNDLKLNASNRDFTAGFGLKFEDTELLKNWGVYGEYSDIYYKSPTENTTTIQQMNLGILISF